MLSLRGPWSPRCGRQLNPPSVWNKVPRTEWRARKGWDRCAEIFIGFHVNFLPKHGVLGLTRSVMKTLFPVERITHRGLPHLNPLR